MPNDFGCGFYTIHTNININNHEELIDTLKKGTSVAFDRAVAASCLQQSGDSNAECLLFILCLRILIWKGRIVNFDCNSENSERSKCWY